MLECRNERCVVDADWSNLELQAVLPDSIKACFFDKIGPMPRFKHNQRQYHRYYFRHRSILNDGGTQLGVFTTDISRLGVGFLSPVQLLPLRSVFLKLPNGAELSLQATRCNRIDRLCYECGARFVRGSAVPYPSCQ